MYKLLIREITVKDYNAMYNVHAILKLLDGCLNYLVDTYLSTLNCQWFVEINSCQGWLENFYFHFFSKGNLRYYKRYSTKFAVVIGQ